MKKDIIAAVIIGVAVVVGAIILVTGRGGSGSSQSMTADNVRVVDGKQIIEIQARGGYQPRKSIAKAGIPTTIRFITNGTFDCSASVRIASLGISKLLPQTGTTDIDVGSSSASVVRGTCGMGMYPFEIDFQ